MSRVFRFHRRRSNAKEAEIAVTYARILFEPYAVQMCLGEIDFGVGNI